MSNPIDRSHGAPQNIYVEPPKKNIGFFTDLGISAFSGAAAMIPITPLVYYKNQAQAKAAFKAVQTDKLPHFIKMNKGEVLQKMQRAFAEMEKNPRVIYRGFGGAAGWFGLAVALQMPVSEVLNSKMNAFYASLTAGVASALVICPSDVILNQQQKTGKSFVKTISHIYSQYGITGGLYKGFAATAIREGVFTSACFTAVPFFKDYLKSKGWSDSQAQVGAGLISGIFAAVLTQTTDTYKTQHQRELSMNKPMIKALCDPKGLAGLKWRIAIVVAALIFVPAVRETGNEIIEKYHS
jgi:hypothetical protein